MSGKLTTKSADETYGFSYQPTIKTVIANLRNLEEMLEAATEKMCTDKSKNYNQYAHLASVERSVRVSRDIAELAQRNI